MDGLLDDPCWSNALPVPADYVDGMVGQLADRPCMKVRYTWDDRYLYIGYETFDTNMQAAGTGTQDGPRDNRREGAAIWGATQRVDVVEFFISFGDPHFFWEIHHNALNQFNDVWCTVPEPDWPLAKSSLVRYGILFGHEDFIRDDGVHRLATVARAKPRADGQPSTVNDASDTDTGYTAEIRIPWFGLGAPTACRDAKTGAWRMDGVSLRILAVVQDLDRASRYHHSSPTRRAGWFHLTFADWPAYGLRPSAP